MTISLIRNFTPSMRDVLDVLRSEATKTEYSNYHCYCCTLSNKEIEERSGWSNTSVKNATNLFCAMELVRKNACNEDCPKNYNKKKGRKKNHYQLLIDQLIEELG